MSHTIKIATIEPMYRNSMSHTPYTWEVTLFHSNGEIARITHVKTERGALRIMDTWSRKGTTKGAKRNVHTPIQFIYPDGNHTSRDTVDDIGQYGQEDMSPDKYAYLDHSS